METKEGKLRKETKEKWTSKIVLSFFRHGEKVKGNFKGKEDIEVRLTQEGREQAIEKSKETEIKQSLAFGSPRIRAQETAGLVMAGKREEITGNETFEELKEKLDKELKFGSKIGIDKRLDFSIPKNKEFRKRTFKSLKKGKFLKFLIEESDGLAKRYDEKGGTTYSRAASNVAEILLKNLKISPHWDRLVREGKKYSEVLNRFSGTHQGVGECFLAKIIELKGEEKEKGEGIKRRNEFVKALDNQGFDYVEGFDVEILKKKDKEPVIKIDYTKKENNKVIFEIHEEIDKEFLDKLIIKNGE